MTFPGLGGQQPPPQNASPAQQPVPGVTPGVTGQLVAQRVIIVGANGELLIYNPSIANGDLVVSAAGAAGTGLAGDTVVPGLAAYDSSGDYAQLFSAALNFFITGMFQAAQILGGPAGFLQASSGATNNTDISASIVLGSANAEGGTATITFNAGLAQTTANALVNGNLTVNGTLTVGGSTSTGTAQPAGVPTGGPNGGVFAGHTHDFDGHTHPL